MESRRAAVAADSADYSRAVTHWAIAHSDAVMARHAILTGINITLLLVTVIGGRIVPAFTASALRTSAAPAGLIALPCPLVVDPAIALGYGFLLMAALTRVFGLSVLGLPYPMVIVISACCWTVAFACVPGHLCADSPVTPG